MTIEWEPGAADRRGLPRPIYDDPKWGPKPVPWTSAEDGDGLPDIGRQDLHKGSDRDEKLLCAVCGLPLTDPVYYFEALENGTPLYPGLHKRCARLSLAHCPDLNPIQGPYDMPLEYWPLASKTSAEDAALEAAFGEYK